MKKIKTSIIAMLFTAACLWSQNFLYTQNNNNYVREGAGTYFNLVEILPSGVRLKVLSERKRWLEVELENGKRGWISRKSLSSKNSGKQGKSKLSTKWASSQVSKVGLSGAIKGLSGKAGESMAGDVNLLMRLTRNEITEAQELGFVKLLDLYESENRGEVDLDDVGVDIEEYDPDLEEQQIGIGVASRLVAGGVIADQNIVNYLNLVMRALMIKSDFYDWEFHIAMLNSDKVDGFACPGGYIFITKGAFLSCEDEAELAGIIAHEIAHVLKKHGVKELKQRETHISMDDAFAELDEELDEMDESSALEGELNDMIANSFEKVVHMRTLQYELQADTISSVLCANAGYDPFGIARVTRRMALTHVKEKNIFNDNYLAPNDLLTRAKAVSEFTDEEFEKENPGGKFKSRFNKFYEILEAF